MLLSMLQSKTDTDRPSLLRQLVCEVDTLDVKGMKEVLRKAKMQKALQLAKKADEQLVDAFKLFTEDELDEMVRKNRKNKDAKQ